MSFTLGARDLSYWHPGLHRWVVEGGEFVIEVGASSRDLRGSVSLEIEGEPLWGELTPMSTIEEWFAHPVGGPLLQAALVPPADMGPLDETMQAMIQQMPAKVIADFGLLRLRPRDAGHAGGQGRRGLTTHRRENGTSRCRSRGWDTRAMDLDAVLARLDAAGVWLDPGLSADELADVERRFGFTFCADHRELLALAVPVGDRWPDWLDEDEVPPSAAGVAGRRGRRRRGRERLLAGVLGSTTGRRARGGGPPAPRRGPDDGPRVLAPLPAERSRGAGDARLLDLPDGRHPLRLRPGGLPRARAPRPVIAGARAGRLAQGPVLVRPGGRRRPRRL